jgi:hypothetical protein
MRLGAMVGLVVSGQTRKQSELRRVSKIVNLLRSFHD